MRNKAVTKWIITNKRDVDLLAGNPYANQLNVAIREWRHAINKAGPTLNRLEDCIRQFRSFIETPKGAALLAVAHDRNGNGGHQTQRPYGQAVNVERPAQRVARTNKNGRAVR